MIYKLWQDAEPIGKIRGMTPHRTIVLVTGVYDLLHVGHVSSLLRASAFGSYLVVGINSDLSAAKVKRKPIINEDDRAYLLNALAVVRDVVIFGEDHPGELVKAVRPNVFCKGKEYVGAELPERAAVHGCGGRVVFLNHEYPVHTSEIIQCIRHGS